MDSYVCLLACLFGVCRQMMWLYCLKYDIHSNVSHCRGQLSREWRQCKHANNEWFLVPWLIRKFDLHGLRSWRCFLLRPMR